MFYFLLHFWQFYSIFHCFFSLLTEEEIYDLSFHVLRKTKFNLSLKNEIQDRYIKIHDFQYSKDHIFATENNHQR